VGYHETMKKQMHESGLGEELVQKVYHPNRIYKYLETYGYDLAEDTYTSFRSQYR
jgi:hypothetical protein